MTANDFSGFADLNGAPLYYEITGAGEPLVLIHAGIADSRMWRAQAAAFRAHRRVITFDLRGFGRSQIPAAAVRHHEDIYALLTHLELGRADIVGISFGGRVAIDFALAYPQHVGRIVLGAPSIGGEASSPEIDAFGEQEEDLLDAGDLDAATDLNVRFWVDGPHRSADHVPATVRELVRTMQRDAFGVPIPDGARFEGLKPPAIDRLNELTMPLLVLVGDADHAPVIERARLLAQTAPDAHLIVMPDAGHMLSLEYPEAFNDHLRAFLNIPR
jgi:pimeloyl-ACP methyl ester carboxylesterase